MSRNRHRRSSVWMEIAEACCEVLRDYNCQDRGGGMERVWDLMAGCGGDPWAGINCTWL